jgi:branched-chain amino acid transport system substrate-binding protein
MTKNLIGRRAAVAGTLGGIVTAHSRIARAADPIKIGFSIPQSGGLAAMASRRCLPYRSGPTM